MKIQHYLILSLCLLGAVFSGSEVRADQFPAVVEAEVKAVIAAEREGVLSRLGVDTGDHVKKGSVLGVVFHKDLKLRKELHEATRSYLRVQVENLSKLSAKGLVADEELVKAKTDLAVNGKEIDMVKDTIDRSDIRAPFSGVIVARQVQPHEWVKPGQPVVEMYDPRRLRIVADIPADVAVKLKTGQSHTFYFPDISQNLQGKLKVFSPRVDVRSNTIKIYWTVGPESHKKLRLMPGMKGVLKLENE